MASIANIYNPQNQPKEDLIENFVVRQKEFKMLFADIKKGKMKTPEQHYMIQGQRGMGKTTLLMRLYYEVLADVKLNKWLVPVLFSEEQYSIRKLYKLWEHLAKYLEDYDDAFLGLFEEMEAHIEEDDYEDTCLDILLKSIRKHKKKMILLLDNFGDLLEKFSLKERQRLREVLIKTPEIRIVGGSSRVLEHTFDHQEPFFEFFKIIQLDGLSEPEVRSLLRNLGSEEQKKKIEQILKESPGRIESLRRLSGGVPRTMVLLFEIFVDEETGGSFKDLESLLDRVTPLYKHRMDELKPNQQEIVEVIALNWDGMPVKDIARLTRMESNVVSAQLTQLEKNRIVTKIPTSTKNNLYMLSERFFNIWYIMRYGRRKDQCRVKWLTEFLRTWCSETELEQRVKKHLHNLSKGLLNESYAYHMTEALAQLIPMGDRQNELISTTSEFLSSKGSKWSQALKASDMELLKKSIEAFENKDYEKVIAILKKVRDKGVSNFLIGELHREKKNFSKAEKHFLDALSTGNTDSLEGLGKLYQYGVKDFDGAEEYHLKAIEAGSVDSLNNLGVLYQNEFKDFPKAEKYYLKAAEAGNTDSLSNLGVLYENEFKDFIKAEEYYLKAAEAGNAHSLNNLGVLHQNEFKDFIKAEEYYLKAAEAGNAHSLNNLGVLYQNEFKDFIKAEEYYLKAAEAGNAYSLNGLGILYKNEFKDFIKAEEYYSKAIEAGNTDSLNNLGILYQNEFKDFIKAEEYYLKAAEAGNTDSLNNLGVLYENEFKDFPKAEEYYLKAAEAGNTNSLNCLGVLYENEFKDFPKAKEYYLKAIEAGDANSMRNLGLLYHNEFKDFEKAKQYYTMAVDQGNPEGLNSLLWMYFKNSINRDQAQKLSIEASKQKPGMHATHTIACVALWNDVFNLAYENIEKFINDEKAHEEFGDDISLLLNLLLAKEQYHYALRLFKEGTIDLEERYKPIYYALMHLMRDEFPNEILKMGPELKETVDEVLEEVKQLAIKYA